MDRMSLLPSRLSTPRPFRAPSASRGSPSLGGGARLEQCFHLLLSEGCEREDCVRSTESASPKPGPLSALPGLFFMQEFWAHEIAFELLFQRFRITRLPQWTYLLDVVPRWPWYPDSWPPAQRWPYELSLPDDAPAPAAHRGLQTSTTTPLSAPALAGASEPPLEASPLYTLSFLRRTSGKLDGLLSLATSENWTVLEHIAIPFCSSDRIAQFIRYGLNWSSGPRSLAGLGSEPPQLLVAHVHLSFPHNQRHVKIQFQQGEHLLEAIDLLLAENPALKRWPIMLLGDWNAESTSPLFERLEAQGFRSTYRLLHAGAEPSVTHHAHNDRHFNPDSIWIRNPTHSASDLDAAQSKSTVCGMITPYCAALLPVCLSSDQWPEPEDWSLSDHRPLRVQFTYSLCS